MSDTAAPQSLYIDGKWVASSDGGTRTVICPADGEVVDVVSEATAADTEKAIAAARRAFDEGSWSATPAAERGDLLLKVADAMAERKDEFARAEALDTGKRLVEAEGDMDDIMNCFRFFGKIADQHPGRLVDAGNPAVISQVVYEPVGVCGMITPWNFPLLQASWKIAPAIAAGCTFVLKPSELTPHTAILIMDVLDKLGLPAGVGNLVLGAGAEAGAPLSSHPDVDMVSFTGGLVTGKKIAEVASHTVKKVALELGGKNPNIVFADADFDAALDNALNAGFLDSGLVCSAGTRLIVQDTIRDRFVDELVRRAEGIVLGGPFDEKAESGPLISEEHRAKVTDYVKRGVEAGATLRCGGDWGGPELEKGCFYRPTVLDNCTLDNPAVIEEGFGPVITVESFSTEAEAVATANHTEYGLAGAVWTSDRGVAHRVSRALRHGTIWINDYHPYVPQAEWGGFKASGNGRELGHTGLEEYREAKHIYENTEPAVTGWFPEK
ncbi:aldehyde dehydrogenase family protein [Corynebacterium variabile]|uniref:aldehyde dehydrogenase family protein n=1 Tax=Corynebacterium variabile TaxID=1727 RepID=UPI002647466D|nr:aldehyde dehydrogenase family protein [Corynebacterium variabile]MDN6476930.1 aldehyde dehydrogenase family protein [Corynebacterium variabile]MDN6675878.1 aldehyde dehydrogenase family protein [Corynebacterium variabile]MDN6812937.1 aldehyde dehydrogenase family protein [Corynebacterium variabile]MDN6843748.1 aldehyde dehydrogenase family protein [Corynebacterium variabile]